MKFPLVVVTLILASLSAAAAPANLGQFILDATAANEATSLKLVTEGLFSQDPLMHAAAARFAATRA
jgi:hypothetical protein